MVMVRCGHLSITGNFRDNNEDSYVVDPQGRFYIVADGMGGQSAGERASALAIELVSQRLCELLNFTNDPPDKVAQCIDEAVAHANAEIMAVGEIDPRYHSMGTTVAFAVVVGDTFYIGNVGDSRVYHWRPQQTLAQLTTDHSLTEALVQAGTISREEAATHRYRNILYRYLGAKEGASGTDAKPLNPVPGDRLVICSDGVSDGIGTDVLRQLLEQYDDPQSAAKAIIAAAEAGGSKDNITCVVLHIH